MRGAKRLISHLTLFLPELWWLLGQRTLRPLARLRFSTFLPPGVCILLRNPWTRANDLRDLDRFVIASEALPALT